MGGDVARLHALPREGQPGGDAARDQRRQTRAPALLSGSGLRPHDAVLAPDRGGEAQLQDDFATDRILHAGRVFARMPPFTTFWRDLKVVPRESLLNRNFG